MSAPAFAEPSRKEVPKGKGHHGAPFNESAPLKDHLVDFVQISAARVTGNVVPVTFPNETSSPSMQKERAPGPQPVDCGACCGVWGTVGTLPSWSLVDRGFPLRKDREWLCAAHLIQEKSSASHTGLGFQVDGGEMLSA